MENATNSFKEIFEYLNQITWKKAVLHLFVLSSCVFLYKLYTLEEYPFEVAIPISFGNPTIHEKDIKRLLKVIESKSIRLVRDEDLGALLLFYFHDRDPLISGFKYLKRSSFFVITQEGVFYRKHPLLNMSQDLPVLTMRYETLDSPPDKCVFTPTEMSAYKVRLLQNGIVASLSYMVRDDAGQIIGYYTAMFYKRPTEVKIDRVCQGLGQIVESMKNTEEYIYLFDLAIRTK